MVSLSSRNSWISTNQEDESDSVSVSDLSYALDDGHKEQLYVGELKIRNAAETPDTLCVRLVGSSLKQKVAMGAAASLAVLGSIASGCLSYFAVDALVKNGTITSDYAALTSSAISTTGATLSSLPLACLVIYRGHAQRQVTRREGDMVELVSVASKEGYTNFAVEDV